MMILPVIPARSHVDVDDITENSEETFYFITEHK